MSNQELKFSRGEIDRAGDVLARGAVHVTNEKAWEILENWRASHHVPLQYLAINLRRHAEKVDKNALLARRLKRAPAIFAKLKRENEMLLSRMQDVAGCRAIMPSLAKTLQLVQSFKSSTQNHEFVREKNYIDSPKPSGYRGVHLIYKFKSTEAKNLPWNGRAVEIQIRSRYQHIWATAVEIVGMLTHQALKSSKGSQDWLDFFKVVSDGFALLDKGEKVPDVLARKITKLAKLLDVQKRLAAYSYAIKTVEKANANFYLLVIEDMQLNIKGFKDSDVADTAYAEEEKRLVNNPNSDVVLVVAESFHSLKRAYPNYFGDSQRFLKELSSLIILRKQWWQFLK